MDIGVALIGVIGAAFTDVITTTTIIITTSF